MRLQLFLFGCLGAVWLAMTLRALSPYIIMRPPIFMDRSDFHPVGTTRLPSGGELYRMNECGRYHRPHLTLHGNGKSVGDFVVHYNQLIERGYCVYTLEYSYYLTYTMRIPRITEFQRDAIEAVAAINRPELTVFGASLGGSILASVVHELVPQPAQIGFIGAFANVTDLAESILPYSSYLLSFDYGLHLQKINPWSTYRGDAVVVHAKDDIVVPIRNGHDLCDAFIRCQYVEEVDGWKHVAVCLQRFDQWKDMILSADLTSLSWPIAPIYLPVGQVVSVIESHCPSVPAQLPPPERIDDVPSEEDIPPNEFPPCIIGDCLGHSLGGSELSLSE